MTGRLKNSKRLRREDNMTEEICKEKLQEQLKDFGVKNELPTVFIDALHDPEDEQETTQFQEQMNRLKSYLLKNEKYSCEGVDNVMALLNLTNQQLDEEKNKHKRTKTELNDTKNKLTEKEKEFKKYKEDRKLAIYLFIYW